MDHHMRHEKEITGSRAPSELVWQRKTQATRMQFHNPGRTKGRILSAHAQTITFPCNKTNFIKNYYYKKKTTTTKRFLRSPWYKATVRDLQKSPPNQPTLKPPTSQHRSSIWSRSACKELGQWSLTWVFGRLFIAMGITVEKKKPVYQ